MANETKFQERDLTSEPESKLPLRTEPAKKIDKDPRVLMAAERTLLAWIRTGVAMMGFGFVVARFGLFLRELAAANGHDAIHHASVSPLVGTGLILFGSLAVALATVKHIRFIARYQAGEELEPNAISLETVLAGLLVVAGVGLAGYLLLL